MTDREHWLQQVMRRHERPLVSFAAHITGSGELARDVVQDTFARLCQADRAAVEQRVASWLFKVCRNRALDVKIQVELDPRHVAAYRLVGYENRLLAERDFDDDEKDAGEIGAGHTVTALYELVPAGQPVPGRESGVPRRHRARGGELMVVRLRYRQPDGARSRLLEVPVRARPAGSIAKAPADLKLAAAVAWFGMELRGSPHRGTLENPLGRILRLARRGVGQDPHGYRRELLGLIRKAEALTVDLEQSQRAKDLLERATDLRRRARRAYIAGEHARSIRLARQVLKLSPGNTDAIQIIGAASCYLKEVDQAKWAHERLRPAARALVRTICLRNGIDLE